MTEMADSPMAAALRAALPQAVSTIVLADADEVRACHMRSLPS